MGRSAIVLLGTLACGSRSDLTPPPTVRGCSSEVMAARACKTLAIGTAPKLIGAKLDSAYQLLDRGDHVDIIEGTKVTSVAATASSIAVTGTTERPDLCGNVTPSGDWLASMCNTPFTVFRVYDAAYTKVTERELASGSLSGLTVGGPASTWLVTWWGSAAVLGVDTQPIVGPIDEIARFVDTPCGFVGVTTVGNPSKALDYGADFGAPTGTSVAFDTITSPNGSALDGVVRWPYDGESIAVTIEMGGFQATPTPLDVVSPEGARHFTITGTSPVATPLGLVVVTSDSSFVGPLALRIVDVDGSEGAPLQFAKPTTPTAGLSSLRLVWSQGVVVAVWAEYDLPATTRVFATTVRCDD